VPELWTLGIITHTQKYEKSKNNRVGRAGDYDSLKSSRAAHIQEGISGVFFRRMVVELVSVLHCLAGIYYYWLRQLLQAEVS
jgi:hypothetical protein